MLAAVLAAVTPAILPATALAQEKPLAAVSISSLDKLMASVDTLGEVAGIGTFTGIFKLQAAAFTEGADATRPCGVLIFPSETGATALGFVPVKDLKKLLATFKADDPKDGVYEINAPGSRQPLFVKAHKSFAFVAQEPDALAKLPDDPIALLNGQEKEYDITARVYAKNVPEAWKTLAVGWLQTQTDNLPRQGDESDEDFELRQKTVRASMKQAEQYIQDADQVTLGLTVDPKAKSTFLEFNLVAADGTQTAKYLGGLGGLKSNFAGLAAAGSAVAMNLGYKLSPEDIERTVAMLGQGRDRINKKIDEDGNLGGDAAKGAVKGLVKDALDVLQKTLEAGTIDGAATLMLDEDALTFVAGGLVLDSAKLEATFKRAVDLAKNEPNFPGVKFDADNHKGVTFHHASVPVPDPKAARVLGEKADVVFGFGKDQFYLAVGKDAIGKLKQSIDKTGTASEAKPFSLAVAMGPILRFAVAADDTPNPIAGALAKEVGKYAGKDRLLISARPITNGLSYRMEIEEGILKTAGTAVGAMALGGQ